MQLRYARMAQGNFGDDLNVDLWPELFPDLAAHHPEAHLYGVGTLLGGSRPDGPKVVLGSGSGYRGAPALDDDWRVYWVRGPRTAQRCGLDPALGLGDGAVLWSGLRRAHAPVPGRIGLVPHHKSYDGADWDAIARNAGLFPIDPRQSPEAVTAALAGCERVLTESLHGAIFADTLGIPWRAVVLARRFNDFKWGDWLDTLGMTLDAAEVDVELLRALPFAKVIGNRLARWTDRGGADARNHLRPVRAATVDDIARVVDALRGFAADSAKFVVSDLSRRAAQQAAMHERCVQFAKDYGLMFAG
ncbi:MAG: polysaccharide pyruvyl transferase family protein [Lysobacter sp.]|nr:polysaccharide pyruvyl transferase family protein [Lysobacter sp.]